MGQLNVNGSLDVTGNATLKSDVLMNSDFGSATQGYAIRAWISFCLLYTSDAADE